MERYLSFIRRELRGGSKGGGYSGGGGGGYSGGGYTGGGYHGGGYHHGSNQYNQPCYDVNGTITSYTCRRSGGDLNPAVIILIIAALGLCLLGVYCYTRKQGTQTAAQQSDKMSDEDFERIISDERDEVKQHGRNISNKSIHVPKSGTYTMAYEDRGSIHEGTVQLSFHDVGDGYSITGEVLDADGKSIIQEGFVTYDGRAYWKDNCMESSSGDVGMSVVSKGTFDFEVNNFQGNWMAITGIAGPYTRFSLLHESTGSEGSTLAESEEGDIAVPASAAPIVPQAPVLSDDEKFDANPPASNPNQGGSTSLFDQMQSGLRGLR